MCLFKCCSVALKATSLRCVKPLRLLQSGIFNESSRECHTLWDATQYKPSLPSVQCCGYVTRAWALKCRNIRWVSQLRRLASTPSVLLVECESVAKRLWRRVRRESVSMGIEGLLSTQPQKPPCKVVMWMLLTGGSLHCPSAEGELTSTSKTQLLGPFFCSSHIFTVQVCKEPFWESGRLQFIAPVT